MLYQLPNGKVIHLTIEEYLNLTDEDIQTLIALNSGEYPNSYWFGSCLKNSEPLSQPFKDESIMSFEEQDDYLNELNKFDINNIPDEEIDNLDLD